MGGEEARQIKFRKKLEQQVKCGIITEAEAEEKLEKFGRPKRKEVEGLESPSFTLLNSDRGLRKRQQVENIASVLLDHFGRISSSFCQISSSSSEKKKSLVVDFGCGSGNLCLALAAAFPRTTFLLTDRNSQSLDLVSKRAGQGGLTNVVTKYFSFAWDNLDCFSSEVMSEHGQLWDLGIGLHCCGAFTDMVLELCRRCDSDCLVAPCCNGKMHQHFLEGESARVEAQTLEKGDIVLEEQLARVEVNTLEGESKGNQQVLEFDRNTKGKSKDHSGFATEPGGEVKKECLNFYPRSTLFSSLLSRQQYWALSRAADDDNHYPAKCLVEYDRARGQEESNAKVSLLIMDPPSASPKHHVIYCSRS